MPNPGQPTIRPGATGNVVRRLQRAVRRTPNLTLAIDGIFGPELERAVRDFQEGAGLAVDAIVGPLSWNALPNGGPMPVLREGSSGDVVRALQQASHQRRVRRVGDRPAGNRREFRPAYQGFRAGVSVLGRRGRRWSGRRPDLGGLAACGQRHLGERRRPQVRRRLTAAAVARVASRALLTLPPAARAHRCR
jgi:hypothetical protein